MNLCKYMFSKKNIEMFIKKDKLENKKEKTVIIEPPEKGDFVEPYYDDKLFWCFYILKYGILEYELIGNNNYKYKMREFMKIMNKTDNNKFKTDIMNSKKLSLKNFIKLCEIEKINLFVENKNFYSEIILNDGKKNIIKYENEQYSVLEKCSKDDMSHLEKKCRVLNIEKPLLAFSNYKAADLRKMGIKLNLDIMNGKKYKTKREIYQLIHSKIE